VDRRKGGIPVAVRTETCNDDVSNAISELMRLALPLHQFVILVQKRIHPLCPQIARPDVFIASIV
jgi:hypothetical protein